MIKILSLLAVFFLQCLPTIAGNELVAGTPKRLIGNWGSGPGQCAGSHRSGGHDNLWSISESYYSVCAGSACGGQFLQHRKIAKNQYRLDSVAGSRNTKSKYFISFITDDIIEESSSYDDFKKITTYVRCEKRHAKKSVGRPTMDLGGLDRGETQTDSVIYSAIYATQGARNCRGFSINTDALKKTLGAASAILRRQRRQQIIEDPSRTWSSPDEWVKFRTEYALELSSADVAVDITTIGEDSFCNSLFQAFGAKGEIIPQLVEDRYRSSG